MTNKRQNKDKTLSRDASLLNHILSSIKVTDSGFCDIDANKSKVYFLCYEDAEKEYVVTKTSEIINEYAVRNGISRLMQVFKKYERKYKLPIRLCK